MDKEPEVRIRAQIHSLQSALQLHCSTMHTKRDGLTRLQTLALHSYALLLLRQRSESMRVSAVANTLALEIGL
jgi:hypothetical protein